MRIAIIGGTHPRHLYYHSAIAKEFNVVGALLEHRENMIPKPPDWITEHDRELWERHFDNRDTCEAKYFGDPQLDVPTRKVLQENINSPTSQKYITDLKPDIILIFGCHMINWYLDVPMINLHLGLSPRYRGSATLFWPFYFLEPNHAGCTFHQIVDEPDAGKILHQCRPYLLHGDTIHDVSCRAVVQATNDMLLLLHKFPDWEYHEQKNTGKCFLGGDFQPQHLRPIYDTWEDGITGAYLRAEIKPKEPWLFERNLDNV